MTLVVHFLLWFAVITIVDFGGKEGSLRELPDYASDLSQFGHQAVAKLDLMLSRQRRIHGHS